MDAKLKPLSFALLFLWLGGMTGCGKKAKEEGKANVAKPEPQVPEIESALEKQDLICGSGRNCPGYITKIAIRDNDKLRFCTGFLTDQQTVVTASSCLPGFLQGENTNCSKDIFFFFAELNARPIRRGCSYVSKIAPVEGRDPRLWRSDIAYLKLDQKIDRATLITSRDDRGIIDMNKYVVWSVDQTGDVQGIIKKTENCQAVFNTYVNPLANKEASPVIVMANCAFADGNSGSPILDYRNKIRGIISRPVSDDLIKQAEARGYLDTQIKELTHVTNFACAPTLNDDLPIDPIECAKDLNSKTIDDLQNDMTNEDRLFRVAIAKVKKQVNELGQYLEIDVVKTPAANGANLLTYVPKCFKNYNVWKGYFSDWKPSRAYTDKLNLNKVTLKAYMDEFSRMRLSENTNRVLMNFQFKPGQLKAPSKKTDVFIWEEGRESVRFANIPQGCDLLL